MVLVKRGFCRWKCIFLMFLLWAAFFTTAVARIPSNASYVGSETCADCHDDISVSFNYNVHRISIKSSDGANDIYCESCHGPGSEHIKDGDPNLIYSFNRDYKPNEKSPCLDCHRGYPEGYAMGEHHPETDNGCLDCHKIHSDNQRLLKTDEQTLCLGCHKEKMGEFRMPSHHPVLEGLMSCTDCHSMHGKKSVQFSGMDNREKCLGCHSDKQGPFIYEHDPVNEDCLICHKPHGSVADNLLTQAEPFVCLSCHPAHFHTLITGYDGEFEAPLHPDRGGLSTKTGFKSAMLTKCTECHSEIHGSDLPSQSISGQGGALTR